MPDLKAKLSDVPKSPGVYQFKAADGAVLYVGKAKNLKSRIGQYLNGHDDREQIPFLLKEASDFTYTVVNNELESLFLENTLIKEYLPRYNIMLRDDKNYAFIKIDYTTEIPQIGYARKIEPKFEIRNSKFETNPKFQNLNSKPKYFGPYSAAYKIRNTLHLMRRIFPYCAAQKVTSRPCFYYYMHRCPGVCVGKISLDDYRKYLEKIVKFLQGNFGEIRKQLKTEMQAASKAKKFEAAARLRDQLRSLELLEEKQSVILPKKVDWDLVSLATSDGYACVNLFKIREGKMRDKEDFVFEMGSCVEARRGVPNPKDGTPWRAATGSLILQSFLEKYYLETSDVPLSVYTQTSAEDPELVKHIIRSRFSRKADVLTPQKGKIAKLIALGKVNAEEYLKNWLSDQAGHLDKINSALTQLKEILNLEKIPQRIECYDISNIQGTNAVGSMVVFVNGLPKKSEYRKFKIKTKSTPDDFAMMREMLSRRFSRIIGATSSGTPRRAEQIGMPRHASTWPTPDLIIIDGGKGQLSAALGALKKFPNFSISQFPIIGLAKRIEEIFLPDRPDPIVLAHDQPALQLLQRLRDEAHRFGITFHRQLRSKQAVKSALDDIPGLGPKTKKLLKQTFGTVAGVRKATSDELAKVVGTNLAATIKQSL